MEQIRHGVFETNSSSTHSFTIRKTNHSSLLVKDNVLNYDKLEDLVTNFEIDEGWVLKCSTYEEKYSLIIHTTLNLYVDEDIKDNLKNILKEKCKYNLSYDNIYVRFEMYDEENGNPFDKCKTLEDFQEVLLDLINMAEDNTITFEEKYLPW